MNEILIPISNKEFKEKVTIRFNSINDGFNNYNNKTIEGTEVAFISFLQEAFELNGAENSYVDFYYNVLNDEDKKKLKELINDEDKILLEKFEKNYHEKNIYFKLTKESIPFITRLSTRKYYFQLYILLNILVQFGVIIIRVFLFFIMTIMISSSI